MKSFAYKVVLVAVVITLAGGILIACAPLFLPALAMSFGYFGVLALRDMYRGRKIASVSDFLRLTHSN